MRAQWHWAPRGKHRDGSCQQQHSFGPLLGRSTIEQFHFDSELELTSSVVSEAEKCWQLPGVDAVAVGLLVRVLGEEGVGAPNGRRRDGLVSSNYRTISEDLSEHTAMSTGECGLPERTHSLGLATQPLNISCHISSKA